jgi:hypothetical protein
MAHPELDREAQEKDRALRTAISSRPQEFTEFAGLIEATERESSPPGYFTQATLEGRLFLLRLLDDALAFVRLGTEINKPDAERYTGYKAADHEKLKTKLSSEIIDAKPLVTTPLLVWLGWMVQDFGVNDPMIIELLAGKTPAERAKEAETSMLFDKAARVALVEKLLTGDTSELDASNDPVITMARAVDAKGRALTTALNAIRKDADRHLFTDVPRLYFKIYGPSFAPDADGTLRLSVGKVRGLRNGYTDVPFQTVLAGMFRRAREKAGNPQFVLPVDWVAKESELELEGQFNFASTVDGAQGNSGSPVINARGELVGIHFDKNELGAVTSHVFNEELQRSVTVSSKAIVAALRFYEMSALTTEIGVSAASK